MPRTWTETIMVALLGAVVFCIGFGITYGGFWMYAVAFVLVVIITVVGILSYEEVPSRPPSVALPVFLNKRYYLSLYSIGEGPTFVLTPIENLRVSNYLPVVIPFRYDGVRCLLESDGKKIPGGLVTVEGSITLIPDVKVSERHMTFLNKGGHLRFKTPQSTTFDTAPVGDGETSPIILQVLAMLGQDIREYGATMTWDELTFSKAALSVRLITMLTGLEPDDENDEAIKRFLTEGLSGGIADIVHLGVKIARLNIEEIEPAGKLAEDAEKAADEKLQRTAEEIDTDTSIRLAKKMILATGITEEEFVAKPFEERQNLLREAMETVRINQGRATENIVRSSGNPFADAAAMMHNPPKGNPPPKDTTGS